jgi:four helix bundle protein
MRFPRDELYGLMSQIRRFCSSIPANITEGCGRNGDTQLARFLGIAMGSGPADSNTTYLLAHDLNLLEVAEYES